MMSSVRKLAKIFVNEPQPTLCKMEESVRVWSVEGFRSLAVVTSAVSSSRPLSSGPGCASIFGCPSHPHILTLPPPPPLTSMPEMLLALSCYK